MDNRKVSFSLDSPRYRLVEVAATLRGLSVPQYVRMKVLDSLNQSPPRSVAAEMAELIVELREIRDTVKIPLDSQKTGG